MRNRRSLAVLDLAFFALALFWFIPIIKSDPSPYGYFPESAFVSVAILISRTFAYKNGRGPLLCALEAVIVSAVFIIHRYALNVATGHGM